MVQSSGDLTDLVEASAEQLEVMRQEASGIDASVLMRYIRIFSDLSGQVRYFYPETCPCGGGIDQALSSGHGAESGCSSEPVGYS